MAPAAAGGPLRSRRRADRWEGARRVSHERWLVSYADFITLLFAFFAVMYAVSSVDARKMETFAKGVRVAFDESSEGDGVLPGGQGVLPSEGNALAELAATVQQQLADELASERLNVRVEPRGVIISVPEAGTFTTGNDELSDQARTLMASIAETVREIPNEIRVEGHSDNVPIRTTRFQSNWDLSAARASRVVEFLIEQNISPERLSATGYAEFQPRVANDSDAARALNRRIDLVLTTEQPGTGGDEP